MLGLVRCSNDFQEEQQPPRMCDRLITCTRADLASQRESGRLGHPLEDTCPRRTRVPGGRDSSGLTFALIAWENRKLQFLFLFCSCDLCCFHTVSPVWEPPNSPETQPGPRPPSIRPLPLQAFHTGLTHCPFHGSRTLLSSYACVCV